MPEQEPKPAYWAILPAKVRYDEQLRPNAKLLYAEISALQNVRGYCYASNTSLARLFGIAPRTVRDLLADLEAHGYIHTQVIRDEKNEVVERRIYTEQPLPTVVPPSGENPPYPPPAENGHTSGENLPYPSGENPPLDQYKNRPDIPPIVPQRGRHTRREPKKAPDWKPDRFVRFWAAYPRGEAKQSAIRAWDRLKPTDELIREMAQTLKRQLASDEWQAGFGIPYASTWLNGRRWEDEDRRAPDAAGEECGGWDDDPEVY